MYIATSASLLLAVENTRRLNGDESHTTHRKKENIQVGEHVEKNKSFSGKEIREGDGLKTTENHCMRVRNHDFLPWAPH